MLRPHGTVRQQTRYHCARPYVEWQINHNRDMQQRPQQTQGQRN